MTASIALVLAGGTAFAFWVMNGEGIGSFKTQATGQPLVVESNVPGVVAPGGTITLSGQITNPNSTSVKLGTLTATLGDTAGIDPSEFVLGGMSNSDSVLIKGYETLAWSGLTLTYLDSATVNQTAGMGVTVALKYTLSANSAAPQISVANWNRSVPIDSVTVANGRLTLLDRTTIVPAELGPKVATLTTTVKTDAGSASADFNLFASGFISREAGETIARNSLFTPAHDGDPLLYAQDNSGGNAFCWDQKFYVSDQFKFTDGTTGQCKANSTPLGSTNTYVTKVFGDNTVTTEVTHDGVSMGTSAHRTLDKVATTAYQPILRTGLVAPAAGVSGALTISNSALTIQ